MEAYVHGDGTVRPPLGAILKGIFYNAMHPFILVPLVVVLAGAAYYFSAPEGSGQYVAAAGAALMLAIILLKMRTRLLGD
ncbi:hypothetical protein [Nitrososphaera sp.]|uniref:hypothetical protein n=1 Tax=Nitrososphaera sp. TaxID=1971748 RepID=UPI00307F0C7C